MDITKYVASSREKALLYGDYSTYRAQLSGRLLKCRKKLNLATKNRTKYHAKPEVTPQDIADNQEYLHLQLMTAERAWSTAMAMKSAHEANTKGISGHTRSHIISRLDKAAKAAEHLASILAESASGAGQSDILEARAYAALMRGAEQFEKQSWEPCLRSYAVARIIYSALSSSSRGDVFRELLAETIDPSIRYAAYRLKTPRSLPIPAIARKAFPRSNRELVDAINKIDSSLLKDGNEAGKTGSGSTESTSRTITWRSREVQIEDAMVSTALAALDEAKGTLAEKLDSSPDMSAKDMAAAYDDILNISQDAVDATKQAIDELKAEGLSQGDARMQSLYITRTAVNYEMISWRIGRNRVLTGQHDGALADSTSSSKRRTLKKLPVSKDSAEDTPSRQIARLREKIVLYDGTLQSLETIEELPGVAADERLSEQLEGTAKYFSALKCLAIARSHSLAGNGANALALIKHAFDECSEAVPALARTNSDSESSLRNINISPSDSSFLQNLLRGEVQRYRALVDLEKARKQTGSGTGKSHPIPLCERLGEYPSDGVDLDNIVVYPPRVEMVPVKPLFLDVAWNYIDYPDKNVPGAAKGKSVEQDQKPQKRGWGFWGR